jgi:amino acid transporter
VVVAAPLKRRIGFGLLTAYGVGVMIGAGIYVLIGAVVAEAGVWAPLAFLLAGLIAAPTALSYAEFTSRLPEASGPAVFVRTGLSTPRLGVVVGVAIVAAGTVSAGAVLKGGVGYLSNVLPLAPVVMILALGVLLTAIAAFGVLESLGFAAILTAVELSGLALVVWAGAGAAPVEAAAPSGTGLTVAGLGVAAALAFFAFIGFEDIVNMAEEVRDPERTLPRAILTALAITTVIYAAVCWAAVRAIPAAELAGSQSPLALVWQTARGGDAGFLSVIAVFAALNGVLAQIVMAARVLFGLGRRNRAFAVFTAVHPGRGTPMLATGLIGAAVIVAALALPVALLAELTSAILLAVFAVVNLALIVLKRRSPDAPFRVPGLVPVAGLVLSLGALALTLGTWL